MIDLESSKIDDLVISLTMKVMLYTFKHIREFGRSNVLERFLVLARDLFYEDSGLKMIEKMLLYIYTVNDLKPEKVRRSIVKLISEDKGDIAMTTAERLMKKGMEEGIEKGIEKGLSTTRDILIKFMTSKFGRPLSEGDMTAINACRDIDKLKEAMEVLLSAKAKDEVLRVLG